MKSFVKRPKGSYVLTVRITLWEGVDDDLIESIKSIEPGKLAKTVKEMMRSGNVKKKPEEETDDDIDLSGFGIEM